MVSGISQGTGNGLYHIPGQEVDALKEAANSSALNKAGTVQSTAAGRTQVGGDTVTISEEARKLAEASKEETSGGQPESGAVLAAPKAQSSGEGSNTDLVEQIKKQIAEVKKKLQEAQEQLARAQAKSGQIESVESGEDPSGAAMEAAMAALTGNAEVKATQSEIKMLNQQLVILNEQLLEAMEKQGAGGGAMGTAGLGGTSGSGGLGERISVAS
jgi:hypothetical protein